MFIKSVNYAGEKVVTVSFFDLRGKLDRLKKVRTRALSKPPNEEKGEVELREKKMIKTLFDSTQAEKCLLKN